MTAERVAAADGVQRRSAGRASTARPHLALFPRRQQNKCALKTSAVPSWIYVGMRPPPFSGARFPPGTPTAAFPGLTTPKCIFHYLTQYDNSIIILRPVSGPAKHGETQTLCQLNWVFAACGFPHLREL